MVNSLTESQRQQFDDEGYVKLGRLLDDDALKGLQDRIDAIMLGEATLDYSRVLMQLDSGTGAYDDAGEQSRWQTGRTWSPRDLSQWARRRPFPGSGRWRRLAVSERR